MTTWDPLVCTCSCCSKGELIVITACDIGVILITSPVMFAESVLLIIGTRNSYMQRRSQRIMGRDSEIGTLPRLINQSISLKCVVNKNRTRFRAFDLPNSGCAKRINGAGIYALARTWNLASRIRVSGQTRFTNGNFKCLDTCCVGSRLVFLLKIGNTL
jgi:hypothetical protein